MTPIQLRDETAQKSIDAIADPGFWEEIGPELTEKFKAAAKWISDQGFDACLSALQSQAVEFDVLVSSEAYDEVIKQYPNISYDQFKREFAHSYWQQGARWQHQQMSAQVAALKVEIRKCLKYHDDWVELQKKSVQAKDAEIAELREANSNCISLLLHESRMANVERERKNQEEIALSVEYSLRERLEAIEAELKEHQVSGLQLAREVQDKALEIERLQSALQEIANHRPQKDAANQMREIAKQATRKSP